LSLFLVFIGFHYCVRVYFLMYYINMEVTRPTYAEIDLGKALANLNVIRKHCVGKKIMCVVKGNAYGHGIIEMGRFYQQNNADYLAVAIPEEGVRLRDAGITIPILVLSAISKNQIQLCLEYNLTMTAPSDEKIFQMNEIARSMSRKARVHINIDTGMNRIGVQWNRIHKIINILSSCPEVEPIGIYSHLSSSESDQEKTMLQYDRFCSAIDQFKKNNIHFQDIHLANSGGIINYRGFKDMNMVRAGLCLYGLFDGVVRDGFGLQPILEWKTEVSYFKWVPAGTGIGYGGVSVTDRDTRIITLPVGYADGYVRAFGPAGKVLLGGRAYPIVGSVCMDQMMVDIGPGGQAFCGDPVVLIGRQKSAQVLAADLSENSGVSMYEIVTQISSRVPRVYKKY